MPEAAVHEHGNLTPGEDDVGSHALAPDDHAEGPSENAGRLDEAPTEGQPPGRCPCRDSPSSSPSRADWRAERSSVVPSSAPTVAPATGLRIASLSGAPFEVRAEAPTRLLATVAHAMRSGLPRYGPGREASPDRPLRRLRRHDARLRRHRVSSSRSSPSSGTRMPPQPTRPTSVPIMSSRERSRRSRRSPGRRRDRRSTLPGFQSAQSQRRRARAACALARVPPRARRGRPDCVRHGERSRAARVARVPELSAPPQRRADSPCVPRS